MNETWTFPELVAQAASRIRALPAPKNGQIRAVPDERTVRYYAAIGLLDRPVAMRGRTALYGSRHLAQVVAIKRMQSADRSLAEIQAMWPTLDDDTLARMTGVAIASKGRAARREFWKKPETPQVSDRPQASVRPQVSGLRPQAEDQSPEAQSPEPAIDIRIELSPNVSLVLSVSDAQLTSADVRALRAAAAPLVTELANRGLTAPGLGTLEET